MLAQTEAVFNDFGWKIHFTSTGEPKFAGEKARFEDNHWHFMVHFELVLTVCTRPIYSEVLKKYLGKHSWGVYPNSIMEGVADNKAIPRRLGVTTAEMAEYSHAHIIARHSKSTVTS